MKFLAKPQNMWGWLRVAGLALLVVLLLVVLIAAVLKSSLPWLANFSLAQGGELAVIPLLGVILGAWLEEQDVKSAGERSQHAEAQQVLEARRREILQPLHAAVAGGLSGTQVAAQLAVALPELDGKGRGDALHFLFEKGYLSGEHALDLQGADFSGAQLPRVHLHHACLAGVNLGGAQLGGAHLAHSRLNASSLVKAFLRHADLKGAALNGCDLSGAQLEGASLEGADLSGAQLQGALLKGANLKHAILDGTALDAAVLIETVLPDGRRMTNENGKAYLRARELEEVVNRL